MNDESNVMTRGGCRRRSHAVVLGLAILVAATVGSQPRHATAEPKPQPKAKPEAASAEKSLFDGKTLTGWKAAAFGGEGKVLVKDGTIVMERGDSMTGIVWTGKPPRTNFEVALEGMRLEGSDFFCTTTFPVGKEYCSLVMGGWGGTVVGLSNVNHYDASDNPTSTFEPFKDNTWYRVRIRVSDAKIEAWIDDKQVVKQVRKGNTFGIRSEVDLCCPLGISTWCTKGAVRNIRLRELKADEIKAAAVSDTIE